MSAARGSWEPTRFGLAVQTLHALAREAERRGFLDRGQPVDARALRRMAALSDHELLGIRNFGAKSLDLFRGAFPPPSAGCPPTFVPVEPPATDGARSVEDDRVSATQAADPDDAGPLAVTVTVSFDEASAWTVRRRAMLTGRTPEQYVADVVNGGVSDLIRAEVRRASVLLAVEGA